MQLCSFPLACDHIGSDGIGVRCWAGFARCFFHMVLWWFQSRRLGDMTRDVIVGLLFGATMAMSGKLFAAQPVFF